MDRTVNGPGTAGADPDADLVRLARDGDEGAYERLVVGHQRRAFNVAYRILGDHDEAADATQEAFVQAYRALGSFRGQEGGFRKRECRCQGPASGAGDI